MAQLEITDVRVRLYTRADDKLKAFASITLNDCFIVSDLKVIDGNNGLFVAMPSRKRKDGQFRDIAHPLNSETRQLIEDRVLDLYRQELKQEDVDHSSSTSEEGEAFTSPTPIEPTDVNLIEDDLPNDHDYPKADVG